MFILFIYFSSFICAHLSDLKKTVVFVMRKFFFQLLFKNILRFFRAISHCETHSENLTVQLQCGTNVFIFKNAKISCFVICLLVPLSNQFFFHKRKKNYNSIPEKKNEIH